jgi:hypothetical protein
MNTDCPLRTRRVALVVMLTFVSVGCATPKIPPDALRLSESTLDVRSMQTRTFEVADDTTILAASIAVLQDMEYNLDEVERPLGVLTASKIADLDSAQEKAGLFLLDLICAAGGSDCGYMATASDEEKIILTLVVLPSLARPDEYTARITLQRIVFDQQERVKDMGIIGDPAIYQQIFEQLSKSIFLEVNQQ